MSDQGDKTCPLCAEEMDSTDQQLKPCKCGYEICVWCWNHIIDMAEKDTSEGRCPACRTPYNKEKIVGSTAKCDKVTGDISAEKRLSSRKGKSKSADRKQLSNVRVVQRNLVYVMGLPLSLADEDLLQRKEYFSQYGKVLKVSMSRTAAGAIQQFANNTCSVYITYSKEEEAIQCIQSVHGFVLDDKPLRACFGTTKYCHAWLRNVPCTNPDCLYLHEIGSQEDSFTKDEVISAYTRSRIQQVTGAVNSMQRRSGSMLPPPAEEYCNNSSSSAAKSVNKNPAACAAPSVRVSPPNSSSGRSVALPAGALWGTRASSTQQPPVNVPCSNSSLNKKLETRNPTPFSTAVGSTSQVSSVSSLPTKVVWTEESGTTQSKAKIETTTSDNPTVPVPPPSSSMNTQLHSVPSLKDRDKHIMIPQSSTTNPKNISLTFNGPSLAKDSTTDVKIQNISSDVSYLNIDQRKNSWDSASSEDEKSVVTPELEDDLISFNEQRHRDPEVIIEKVYSPSLPLSLHSSAQHSVYSPRLTNGVGPLKANVDSSSYVYMEKVSNRVADLQAVNGIDYPYSKERFEVEAPSQSRSANDTVGESNIISKRFEVEPPSQSRSTNDTVGESNIISNILSMDFDPWNESLTSPQNLAKLFGETDNQQGSLRVSSSRKFSSSQSRFSFARGEEESLNPSFFDQSFHRRFPVHDFPNSRSSYQADYVGTRNNGFSLANNEESVGFGNSFSHFSSSKLSGSKPQMSAPPGFSAPNRAPPPGFTSHYERMEQNFESLHGNHSLDASSLRNQYQVPHVGNASNGDIEFMDPAILAVGKGMIPNGLNLSSLDTSSSFPPQLNSFENEARLQLLMQRSLNPHQNARFADTGDNYGLSQSPFSSHVVSNGHWDGWNGGQSGGNLGVAELLRTETRGFNKFFNGYEEPNVQMPNSGNLYNRTFGM